MGRTEQGEVLGSDVDGESETLAERLPAIRVRDDGACANMVMVKPVNPDD